MRGGRHSLGAAILFSMILFIIIVIFSVIISWAFDKSSEFGNLSSSSVLSAFSLKVVTQPSSDENHSINDIQSQLVALRFIRENICEPLLQLHFIDSHEPKWLKIDRKGKIVLWIYSIIK